MNDDFQDDGEFDNLEYLPDVVAQRAIAFCNLARAADSAQDPAVRELCLAMMRKVSATIRSPSTAEVRLIHDPEGDSSMK
ncbi:MAG: hypothetical protein JWN93_1677 [Hyphomicrobiales bacterium]|nr:hypothetical protein [Hyphomicrobiales bacterium]